MSALTPYPGRVRANRLNLGMLLFAVALASSACQGPVTALDIRLVPDLNVTSIDQLVSKLGSVVVELDAADGLYPGPSAPPRTEGECWIGDLDNDGHDELRSTVDTASLGRLPLIRLEQGGLSPELLLWITVRGRASQSDEDVAAGQVKGMRFREDEVRDVPVQFNLLPAYRAPQVSKVYPQDNTAGYKVSELLNVMLTFSKEMDVASLNEESLELVRINGSAEERVPFAKITPYTEDSGSGEKVTSVDCAVGDWATTGDYRVRVKSSARDTNGQPLDQIPSEPGAQPFESRFSITQEAIAGVVAETIAKAQCGLEGDACSPGTACYTGSGTLEDPARCMPLECPESCPDGSVCDPAMKSCVMSCLIYGTFNPCKEQGAVCLRSGLCGAPAL